MSLDHGTEHGLNLCQAFCQLGTFFVKLKLHELNSVLKHGLFIVGVLQHLNSQANKKIDGGIRVKRFILFLKFQGLKSNVLKLRKKNTIYPIFD